jgi:hypothetical protein
MEIVAVVRIVRLCFGLLLLWGLFYISIRTFLLDNLRQRLFAIRDDLFDFAADGGVAFEHPCYRELRNDLNGLILFAHKLTVGRAVITYWMMRWPHTKPQVNKWLQHIDQLSPLARRKFLDVHSTALRQVTLYAIRRSLVLHALFLVLSAVALWVDAARTLYRKLPTFAEPLEAQARNEYRPAA